MRSSRISLLALAALLAAPAAAAKLYGADRCASDKLRAAARVCGAALAAHARYEGDQDAGRRDAALGKARGKLARAWARAEKRVAKELDCSETTVPDAGVAALVEAAAVALAAAVNDGLDLDVRRDAACGAELLKASGRACEGLLWASGQHVRHKGDDRLRLRLAADQAEVLAGLAEEAAAARATCASRTTPQALADGLSALADGVLEATTVSPAVAGPGLGWILVKPEAEVRYQGRKLRPICLYGTPYEFFARRGTVNKLVVYFQGGGACWNYAMCRLPTCEPTVGVGDLPRSGLSDLDNPANPFRDWSWVVVPYCTGDVHFGDAEAVYTAPGQSPLVIEHRGFVNARVVEKWARDHFVLPEEVFVAGSSAGAAGAILNAPYMMEFAWPSSHFDVLGDALNTRVTQDFIDDDLPSWRFEQNVPDWIPEFDRSLGELLIGDAYAAFARHYPWNRFATYSTAYDGGDGQSALYNIMLNDGNPFAGRVWWEASCAFREGMQAVNDTAYAGAPDNFRSYVGAGSTHTMWYYEKPYSDTTDGVPTVVDWVNAMLAGSPDWVNVECQDCGVTLPGDPTPPTLPTPPFDENGNVVCGAP